MTDLDTFVHFSDEQIAQRLAVCGEIVCGFPIIGVRRWYTMEFGQFLNGSATPHYHTEVTARLLNLYAMFFRHGVHTLISPLHGLIEEPQELLASRLRWLDILTTHSDFLSFYETFDVRVYFYGDYRRKLAGTPYAHLPGQFERLSKYTRGHRSHRLFYGVFPHHAAENIADLSVRHFISTGQVPDRRTMSELYYGEAIEAVNLFVGFGAFNPSDYPLLDFSHENLYFIAAPSLYLEQDQLRRILHDYLHPRQEPEVAQLSAPELAAMKEFYLAQRNATLGLGSLRPGAWVASRG
ncbi:MAG: hypothetical protein NZP74_04770 [Anaerolineales bacterium]|nr:hypothetical protein [Anaerolineales bacterium]MDW8276685.1 hypothetical protein [Anaerolineales bacterium]